MWKLFLLLISFQASILISQEPVEKVCDLFLQGISVEKGQEVNWAVLKELFIDSAQFIINQGNETKTLSFEDFKNATQYSKWGFKESATERKIVTFGKIAQVAEKFTAEIPMSDTKYKGINMYLLVKEGDEWKIASLTYEVARKDLPLPTNW